jgi:hypothetical protein
MRHRHCTHQLFLLMRDIRGRFVRVRATLAEMARTVRPRIRRPRRQLPAAAEQLTLF